MMFVVKPLLFLLIGAFILPGFNAFVKWTNLKATWCLPSVHNEQCFQDIPRTIKSALMSGWRKTRGSTCRNGGKFNGIRMVKNDDFAITPLYDIQGIIAGVQLNALKSELFATPNPFKYAEVSDYLDNSIESHPVYSLTAYFVDPTTICSSGRNLRQLEMEGTGSSLYFQTGNSPKHLRRIPLYRNVAEKTYTSTNCVPSMGYHNYYELSKMQLSNCTAIVPSFLLFNSNGELHGFGQTTVAELLSRSLEHPKQYDIKAAIDPITPECMLYMAESRGSPGYSNLHFYFIDAPRDVKCSPINQTEAGGNSIYVNPNACKKN